MRPDRWFRTQERHLSIVGVGVGGWGVGGDGDVVGRKWLCGSMRFVLGFFGET